MNIFATDSCPQRAAQNLDDRRLTKMVLETAQLLSTALNSLGYWKPFLYRPTHQSHPCALWTGESRHNFQWLVRHGLSLADEHKYRFGTSHKSRVVIEACSKVFEGCPLDQLTLTPFANCTPYKDQPVVRAYRMYMVTDKWGPLTVWTKRGKPDWYQPHES